MTAPTKSAVVKTEATAESPEASLREQMRAEIEAELRAKIEAEAQQTLETRLAALEARLTAPQVAPAPAPRQTSLLEPEPVLTEENSTLIHFVEDGFTIGSRVYYRGGMARVLKDTEWLSLTPREQVKKYGRRMFRLGPWDGEGFDLDDPALTDEDRARLKQVEKELYSD
jgi:hypothetical protein